MAQTKSRGNTALAKTIKELVRKRIEYTLDQDGSDTIVGLPGVLKVPMRFREDGSYVDPTDQGQVGS
jgi:hypothetical protein